MSSTTTDSIRIEVATERDLPAIQGLLAECNLPWEDLNEKHCLDGDFLVAKQQQCDATNVSEESQLPESSAKIIVGVIGLEVHPPYALLRSMAVRKSHRGRGICKNLCVRIEAQATSKGVKTLYLLTTTAKDYFLAKQGYVEVGCKQTVPEAIRNTGEFSGICPCSATCLSKDLLMMEE